jgi:hypothetical protein
LNIKENIILKVLSKESRAPFNLLKVLKEKKIYSDSLIIDAEKMEACRDAGITLIEIPYWWDQSIGSLHATIYKYRPEIISHPGFILL